jgi:hypothetical protein
MEAWAVAILLMFMLSIGLVLLVLRTIGQGWPR